MGLETATYVSELNASNPAGSDIQDAGDNHLRLIKGAIKATFPNADHAIYLDRPQSDAASASSVDIGAVASNFVRITGTTTITAFASAAAGIRRTVRFAAALTLTHDASSLILPGAANITTAANDTAEFLSLGSGDWLCLWYKKADGSAVTTTSITAASLTDGESWTAEVTVASASTCDILGAASNFVAISGTTTITSFGTGTNKLRFVRFTGALTLTHNATSLILPGGANITTAAGDTCIVISDGSSNARVYAYSGVLTATVAQIRSGVGTGAITPTNWTSALDYVALSDGATITVDFSTGINFSVSLSGNRTLAASNYASLVGKTGKIKVTESGGTRTLDTSGSPFVNVNSQNIAIGTGSGDVHIYYYDIISATQILLSLARDVG